MKFYLKRAASGYSLGRSSTDNPFTETVPESFLGLIYWDEQEKFWAIEIDDLKTLMELATGCKASSGIIIWSDIEDGVFPLLEIYDGYVE